MKNQSESGSGAKGLRTLNDKKAMSADLAETFYMSRHWAGILIATLTPSQFFPVAVELPWNAGLLI